MLGGWVEWNWFLIYLGCLFAFAMTAAGLLRFSEWRYRVTTKDKLSFSNVRFTQMLSPDGMLLAIQLGIDVNNYALFPIQFTVQEVETHLGELYPPKKKHQPDSVIISPNGTGWYNDIPISLERDKLEALRNNVVEGLIQVQLKYGRPDNLNREMTIKKKIFVLFTDNGEAQLSHWHDA